ncbi:MAG: hypothetical protein ACXQTH_04010 [Dehalococcoidia bacterium]
MPKVELELEVEQIARILEALSQQELETLELLLQPRLAAELKQRRQEARTELEKGKTLSKAELFVD